MTENANRPDLVTTHEATWFGDHIGASATAPDAERKMLKAARILSTEWHWIERPRLIRIGHRRWGWHAVGTR